MIKKIIKKIPSYLFVPFLICCIFFFVMYSNILLIDPIIEYNDSFVVKQGDLVNNDFFIKKVTFGKIISKSEILDTSTVGKKNVTITIANIYGKEKDYHYTITIIPN
ncbi:MAG: hypothetical protein IKQ06_00275 [Bacilli bacterium]|nr:hypothetical protein [Bacilli bacterium]